MEGRSTLATKLHTCATVEVLDDTHGLFGELYTPEQVWEALWNDNNNSSPNDSSNDRNVGTPTGNMFCSQDMPQTTYLNSKLEQVTPHEIPLEINNTTLNSTIRVRWIDQVGNNNPSTYLWNISPSSTFSQYSKPGHLFVLSILSSSDDELILGAYRPKRGLPSCTSHCILVHGGGGGDDGSDDNSIPFLLETMLLDESKFDILSVAGAALDHHIHFDKKTAEKTIHILQTVIKNALDHPTDEKYHKLRLSNTKIQQYVASSWAACEILRILGFSEKLLPNTTSDEDHPNASTRGTTKNDKDATNDDNGNDMEAYVVLPTPITENMRQIGEKAMQILRLLQTRLAPEFIPDLAPPTPWQEVGISVGSTSTNRWNNNSSRGFLSDEEKWARAERNAGRRRSGGRRPNPGEAPSSRGKWGR